jgi:probable F420-dependent oxidoreductase
MGMKFIFSYPEITGTEVDMLDAGELGDIAVAVERAGFDGLSLTEHPVPGARWLANGGHQTLDPFVGLGYAAGLTTRIALVTHLSVGPYRNPFLLAKSAATVDKVSGGRMILGVGTGYHKTEFHALGVDFDTRNQLFDEMLEVLPMHWRGEPFSYSGLHFDARDVQALPRPVQDPIPIWIGGNSKLSRRRAATRAQGWMPMPGGPELSATARTPEIADDETLSRHINEVLKTASSVERGPVDIVWTYSDPSIREPSVDDDRHRRAFSSFEKMGVTWLVVSSRTSELAATREFIDGFGATYLQ